MNFGVKQRSRTEDFQAEILSEIKEGLKKRPFYLEDLYCAVGNTASRSVGFEKKRAGRAEVEFIGRLTGKRATVTLYMDGVPFLRKTFAFSADAPTYFAYSKNIFVTSGKHEFKFEVTASESSVELKQGRFCVMAEGVVASFLPQISFAVGRNGERLYLCRYAEAYYLCSGDVGKQNGTPVIFQEEELPQKVKLKVYDDKIYILYKSTQGVWKLAELNEQSYSLGVGIELAVGSDCDFCFRNGTEGEVYYVLNGELYRFSAYNLFATKFVSERKKVTFAGVSQKVRGVFVAPYDNDASEEGYTQYLVVWGVVSVVTALVNTSGGAQGNYYTIAKIITEPNGTTAFAVDNIFGVGALKDGLLSEYKVALGENGVDFSVAKKQYCNSDAVVVKTMAGFVLYDDGEYFII